ncbi:unnamed protein product [Medioppia subpectinata]|uniref:Uncharacterized protein n=1 Tax=Medioppia subpectinata TaxID=1979941 RepID=A0A7R9L0U6_9ACAR|nr:unnamed protein product [Medioppia subpectinata]CAG2113510.1 unnamed protein product [Medioppia subpectinata]
MDINNITKRCEYWDNGCRQVVKQKYLKEHTNNCCYKPAQCSVCHGIHISGRDCIGSLRADIGSLKLVDEETGHDNTGVNAGQSLEPCEILYEHQILVECRRHLTAPEMIDNQMNANMTDKTLSILRKMLRKHNTLFDVCKHVADYMELEFGNNWHCIAYRETDGAHWIIPEHGGYMCVVFTPIRFLVFYSKRFDWTTHHILAECRRYLSAPVVLENQLSADMTDKTLSILRKMLRKHNTLFNVCKHVVYYMDLEYGSSWHCLVGYDEYNGCLIKIHLGHVYVGLYKAGKVFYWANFKARLEHNKIDRKLDIYYTAMNESMISVVTDIVFEAIDSNDNISATMDNIVTQMKARYPINFDNHFSPSPSTFYEQLSDNNEYYQDDANVGFAYMHP